MANNLRKFNTYSDYEAAELVKPAVSLIAATDEVYFDQKEAPVPPTPTFSGLTVYYNITDISQPTELFNGGGGGSGSGSGSGSGGVLPSAMIIDGTAVEVTNTYQFSTTGEHIVNYSFEDNAIPMNFLSDDYGVGKFNTVTKVEIGDTLTGIGDSPFYRCSSLTSCTIGSGVTSIGQYAFDSCSSLISVTVNATTPPTLGSGSTVFSNTNNCPIYVPSQSVEEYKGSTSTGWYEYASRIQAIP